MAEGTGLNAMDDAVTKLLQTTTQNTRKADDLQQTLGALASKLMAIDGKLDQLQLLAENFVARNALSSTSSPMTMTTDVFSVRSEKEIRERFYENILNSSAVQSGEGSSAKMFGCVSEKEIPKNDQPEGTDKSSFNSTIADQEAELETVAKINHDKIKQNKTQGGNGTRSFQFQDVFSLENEGSGDVTIPNDGAMIVKMLEVEHPAVKVLVRRQKGMIEGIFYFFIECCAKSEFYHEAIRVLDVMEKEFGFKPGTFSYNLLLNVLVDGNKLKLVEDVHSMMLINVLIHGICKEGRIEEALSFVQEMANEGFLPDQFTHNTLINGLCKAGHVKHAVETLDLMLQEGFDPNVFTCNTLISGLFKMGEVEEATTTLRFTRSTNRKSVQVLADKGSTHSFVQTRVAKQFNLLIKSTPNCTIVVGNNQKLLSEESKKHVKLIAQGHTIGVNSYVLPFVGSNMVLGDSWMATDSVAAYYSFTLCVDDYMRNKEDGRGLTVSDNSELQSILHKFEQVFATPQQDKHRTKKEILVGDWISVTLQPYRQITVWGSGKQKFNRKFFGPFQIEARSGTVAYQLILPAGSRIYPVSLVSLVGSDVILGVSWLANLGPIIPDYPKLTMKFNSKDKDILLSGNSQMACDHITCQEGRKLQARGSVAAFYSLAMCDDSKIQTLPEDIEFYSLSDQFNEVFATSHGLPLPRTPNDILEVFSDRHLVASANHSTREVQKKLLAQWENLPLETTTWVHNNEFCKAYVASDLEDKKFLIVGGGAPSIKLYMQVSLRGHDNNKLGRTFYGPFQVVKRLAKDFTDKLSDIKEITASSTWEESKQLVEDKLNHFSRCEMGQSGTIVLRGASNHVLSKQIFNSLQQTFSIKKAGITTSLNARTCLYAYELVEVLSDDIDMVLGVSTRSYSLEVFNYESLASGGPMIYWPFFFWLISCLTTDVHASNGI